MTECLYCPRTDLRARGLCEAHYQRWRKGIPLEGPIRATSPRYNGAPCRKDDCQELAKVGNLCSRHYMRVRNYGEASLDLPEFCQACGSTNNLQVDHDHSCCPGAAQQPTCGKCVRGMLCGGCNLALGAVGDDVARLLALIDYLS